MYNFNVNYQEYTYTPFNEFVDILEQASKSFKSVIYEAYSNRSPYLKNIDDAFKRLKNDITDIKAKNSLIKNLSKFTGVKNIYFSIRKDIGLNAGVLPILKKDLLLKKKSKEDAIDVNRIKEDASYIDKFYVMFGEKLIKSLSPRELTAILLHELGHVYNHFSRFTIILMRILRVISSPKSAALASIVLRKRGSVYIDAYGNDYSMDYSGMNLQITIALFLTAYIVSRTLTFIDHIQEYRSDEFAIKYGYGKEMTSVLYFFHKKEAKVGLVKKILNFVFGYILGTATHPPSKKRACKAIDKMINDYKKMYPRISSDIARMMLDLKC